MKALDDFIADLTSEVTDKDLKEILAATAKKAAEIVGEDYAEQMRQVNEEWRRNLMIQRTIMIDKACRWAEEQNYSASVRADLRKYMKEYL